MEGKKNDGFGRSLGGGLEGLWDTQLDLGYHCRYQYHWNFRMCMQIGRRHSLKFSHAWLIVLEYHKGNKNLNKKVY